ncbi:MULTISPECIES: Dabb family protein [Flavobacteriaceae]|uniref:Dabb family protein n=1 Tax=Flavobacteriaceae TaxID=49546 RepID=UPI001C0EF94B|nr:MULTISPECIES: Dabb family protein [Allomuricauda]MDC6364716.1 Dabb family protein [Muricauda sp. AC10]
MNFTPKLYASLLLVGLFFGLTACKQKPENNTVMAEVEETPQVESKDSLLRHVVIFKFNDDSSEADIQQLNEAFNNLPNEISVIKDFEWGLNDSPEDFHQGFTHCYLITFESEKDRDSIYAPHPAHQAFVESLGPHLKKVFVVDYWTNP